MAKRIKLREPLETTDIIAKAQEITTSHDTVKMVKLAEDLRKIAMDITLTPYNRRRLYKDCLRQFRKMQEKVIHDGLSIMDSSTTKEHWDELRALIREELQRHMAKEDDQVQQQYSSYTTPMSTPQSTSVTPMSRRSSEASTPTNDSDPRSTITKILKENGIEWQSGGRVIFPRPLQYPETNYKPSEKGYTSNNVQKAIDFLFSPLQTSTPTKNGMDTIIFNVYYGLRKTRQLPGWIAQYPNLKRIDDQFNEMKSVRWS